MNTRKRLYKRLGYVLLLTTGWYLSALVTITTSKEIMNRLPCPFFLCTIQFAFASIISYSYLTITNNMKSRAAELWSTNFIIAVAYTFGFILTNSAFSIGE